MSDSPKRKAITVSFNILLVLYVIYASFLSYLFDPDANRHVPMDDFFEFAPASFIVAAVVLLALAILLGALILRAFWNRLVSSLFSIRDINYQEALAIILMNVILFEL